jgi:methylthioribose-1-phosphate isomerase
VTALPHPEPLSGESYSAVELSLTNDRVVMLDQRLLPEHEHYVQLASVAEVAEAIRVMVVRGAPAIGISAAYAMVLAALEARGDGGIDSSLERAAVLLKKTRPTAVNLAWAVDRMLRRSRGVAASELHDVLAEEARTIHREDVAACRRMGALGAESVPDGATILTHCNAGALATGGYGTALGVIRAARDAGKRVRVLADETRPYLQGSRLTAWELARSGIDVKVICDNSAAYWFGRGEITLTVVGADRIAQNGDFANKIGTYGLACLSKVHARPFYVAAPWSTVDMACANGDGIPIEHRDPREITEFVRANIRPSGAGDRDAARSSLGPAGEGEAAEHRFRLVPAGVGVLNPAFDVTPAAYVTSLFTERGVVPSPTAAAMLALAGSRGIERGTSS